MDLGATICRPANPRCGECPLSSDCAAFAGGNPAHYPEKRQRAPRPHRHGIAWWIERGSAVWLVRRPAKGLLGGMAALPGMAWDDAPPATPDAIATVRHVFTHFSLDLYIVPPQRTARRGLVAADRPAKRRRSSDPLPQSRGDNACSLTTDLPPEPFFGGPGLDRADALRADDAALHDLTQRHDARELQWQDGLPVLSQDGRLMWGSPSSPELFLGLDDGSPRYSAIQPVVPDAPSAFGAMALLHRDDAPLFAAALSLSRWHGRHRFCANCGHLTEPVRGGWSRRCPSCTAEHYPRVDPVVIMLAENRGTPAPRSPATLSTGALFGARRLRRGRRDARGGRRARAPRGSRHPGPQRPLYRQPALALPVVADGRLPRRGRRRRVDHRYQRAR